MGWIDVYQTDLESAVEEAAVLSGLIAQAFAGRNRVHGSRGDQPLHPGSRSTTGGKIIPLPRHHYLDVPVSWRMQEKDGAKDQAKGSMSLPWERKTENRKKAEQENRVKVGGKRRLWTKEMQDVLDRDLDPIQPSHCPAVFFFFWSGPLMFARDCVVLLFLAPWI